MVLLEPMLARSGPLPLEPGWAYELKLDGFRALVRAGERFEVRSRRGWNMTPHLPELAELPADAVLDGELVALGEDGWPDFPRLCQRMLQGDRRIPVVFIAFDLLELDGRKLTHLPLGERRSLLDGLRLHGPGWHLRRVRRPGGALDGLRRARARGRRREAAPVAVPVGGAGWVKVKNQAYWRYPFEVEAVLEGRERRRAARSAAGF